MFDTDLFSLDCSTFTVTVETSNQDYDISVFGLTLEVISLASETSQSKASVNFSVEVKNSCRDVELLPAQWLETLVKFDFRND